MKVNWDDETPNIWENKKWQPNHQPDEHGNLNKTRGDFLLRLSANFAAATQGDNEKASSKLRSFTVSNQTWKRTTYMGVSWNGGTPK